MREIYLWIVLLLALPVIAQGAVPRFETSDCLFGDEKLEGVECGFVTVPENRGRPDGRMLRLAVVRLRSTAATPRKDAVVFLSGGPGQRAVAYTPRRIKSAFWNQFRKERDLIFFDQRGTGYSDPAFCPELYEVSTAAFRGLSREKQLDLQITKFRECRAKMLQKGIDFSTYNSAASAQDLEDIRKALGYPKWNLFGVSYGTRLALSAMRDAPQGIRSVILDSASPPNIRNWVDAPSRFARSLRLVFDQCKADPACNQSFPNLEKDFYAVLNNLENDPIIVTGLDDRFPEGRMVVDGTLISAGIFLGLYDHRFIRLIPMLIREMKNRNADVLRAVAEGLVQDREDMSVGLQFAVDCFEMASLNPQSEIQAERKRYPELKVFHEFTDEQEWCNVWQDFRADSAETSPVLSNIPTLILAGEFDPITPPLYGRMAASTLPAGKYVEIGAAGHAVSPSSECTQKLIHQFLADPSRSLDTSCVQELKPVAFVTEINLNPGIYRVASRLYPKTDWTFVVGLGIVAVVFLTVLLWPLSYVLRTIRKRSQDVPRTQRIARWVAGFVSVAALSFIALLASTLMRVGTENPFLIAFGLPASANWILILPSFVVAMTPVVAFMAIVSWYQQWQKLAGRIHYSLIAVSSIVFSAFLFTINLLG